MVLLGGRISKIDNFRIIKTGMTAPPEPDAGSTTGPPASKYSTLGSGSRQARLNKEAAQVRQRVQQLLEEVSKQQQQKRTRRDQQLLQQQQGDDAEVSPAKPSSAAASLFLPKQAKSSMAALFSGSGGSSSALNLNTRHLRMNRILTVRLVFFSGKPFIRDHKC